MKCWYDFASGGSGLDGIGIYVFSLMSPEKTASTCEFCIVFTPELHVTDWYRSLLQLVLPVGFLLRKAPNARVAPFFRDRIEIKRYMMMVVIGLAPATIAAVYFWGWRCLFLIFISYLFGGLTEVLFSVVRSSWIRNVVAYDYDRQSQMFAAFSSAWNSANEWDFVALVAGREA